MISSNRVKEVISSIASLIGKFHFSVNVIAFRLQEIRGRELMVISALHFLMSPGFPRALLPKI